MCKNRKIMYFDEIISPKIPKYQKFITKLKEISLY